MGAQAIRLFSVRRRSIDLYVQVRDGLAQGSGQDDSSGRGPCDGKLTPASLVASASTAFRTLNSAEMGPFSKVPPACEAMAMPILNNSGPAR